MFNPSTGHRFETTEQVRSPALPAPSFPNELTACYMQLCIGSVGRERQREGERSEWGIALCVDTGRRRQEPLGVTVVVGREEDRRAAAAGWFLWVTLAYQNI